MKPSRILVCGGRDYNDRYNLFKTMNGCIEFFADEFCVIEGGAPGADKLAGEWAKENGHPLIVVPANWDYYGNSAGTIRNKWMADFCLPDLCMHFKGGVGTSRMVDYCEQKGILTYGPL